MLHVDPDLDGVVSSYLAVALLTTGSIPPGAEALARYVDMVDSGHVGLSQDQPFTLYAAYTLLANRLALRAWRKPEDRYRACVEQGLSIVAYVSEQLAQAQRSIFDIDALRAPASSARMIATRSTVTSIGTGPSCTIPELTPRGSG